MELCIGLKLFLKVCFKGLTQLTFTTVDNILRERGQAKGLMSIPTTSVQSTP